MKHERLADFMGDAMRFALSALSQRTGEAWYQIELFGKPIMLANVVLLRRPYPSTMRH
jgi:hypothetical protein